MVLSTRRGSRRATPPQPRGPGGPDPRPVPEPSPGSAAPPAPPRRRPAASTAAPPPAAALRTPPRHRARPRPRPRPRLPGSGRPRGAGLPGRRRLLCSAPSAMRAAVPALGGARRGSRSAAAAPELLSKVLQAPRPRPPLGRLRRRRAPAPAPARTSVVSLAGARAPHAPARTGLVFPGCRGRRRPQHKSRAVPTGTRPRARGASTRRAPARTRTRAAAGTRGADTAPGVSAPAQLAARSALPLQQQQQPGRVRVRGAPRSRARAGGERQGGAGRSGVGPRTGPARGPAQTRAAFVPAAAPTAAGRGDALRLIPALATRG